MPTIEEARAWYPVDDPVHGFDHVLRVYRLAQILADAEGADQQIVLAAALMHDVESDQGSGTGDRVRAGHHHGSAEFARLVLGAEGWGADRINAVLHCIRAHRFRDDSEQPQTVEAGVLFDADKLDAIGAIGAARAIAYAARAHQPVYSPPSELFIETGRTEAGEPHSAYHEYLYKLRKLKDRLYTTTGRRLADERHRFMTVFFERLVEEISGDG
jgi:uncharacterized protein